MIFILEMIKTYSRVADMFFFLLQNISKSYIQNELNMI